MAICGTRPVLRPFWPSGTATGVDTPTGLRCLAPLDRLDGVDRMTGNTQGASPLTLSAECQEPSNFTVMVEAQAPHPVIRVLSECQ